MNRILIFLVSLVLMTGCSQCALGGTYLLPAEQLMAESQKVLYKRTPQEDLYLYVLNPTKATSNRKSVPAIVCFFGGGWVKGDPSTMIGTAAWFRDQGYVAISADYRVRSRHGTTPLECIQDAKSAIRFVRVHAQQLGVDPQKIIADGGSAGGHIASATALVKGHEEPGEDTTVSSQANALVLHNPVLGGHGFGGSFFNQHSDCAPVNFVTKGLPPTVLSCGTKDPVTPITEAQHFTALMRENGNHCELIEVKYAGHSCDWPVTNPNFLPTVTRMAAFLKENGFSPEAGK